MDDSGIGVLGWMFLLDLLMAVAIAVEADRKGYSGAAWLVYGLFLWPVALIHILLKAPSTEVREKTAVAAGEIKPCPECAELVRRAAQKCRYCGHQFAPALVAPSPARRQVSPESARTAERIRRMGG